MNSTPRSFYDQAYQQADYSPEKSAELHAFYPALSTFVQRWNLADKRCLEVGTGRGAFQHLVSRYVGIDISESAGQYLERPFGTASAVNLPFASNLFDAAWTITVLEHVPHPEKALAELWRVLKPGGCLFLAPAWQCRSWAADGYPVRPYSDFGLGGKLVKASIPLRDSLLYRSISLFPVRLIRLATYLLHRAPTRFHYQTLRPNYEKYWMSDSDAVNSMDPFEAYLWFISRGAEALNYTTLTRALFIRTGPLLFRKPGILSADDNGENL